MKIFNIPNGILENQMVELEKTVQFSMKMVISEILIVILHLGSFVKWILQLTKIHFFVDINKKALRNVLLHIINH